MSNEAKGAAEINREKSGRYGHGFDAMCRCGHRKGAHVAGGHECIAHEIIAGTDVCGCEKFSKARVTK